MVADISGPEFSLQYLKEANGRLAKLAATFRGERDALAKMLGDLVVAAGITEGCNLTGPQLLLFGQDLLDTLRTESARPRRTEQELDAMVEFTRKGYTEAQINEMS